MSDKHSYFSHPIPFLYGESVGGSNVKILQIKKNLVHHINAEK